MEVLKSKKDAIEQSKFIQDHQQQIDTAKEVWGIVDENFRITQTLENAIQSKAQMFDELLLKKVPGLTQEELDYLRQTIAGEVNKGKEALKDDKVKQLQDQVVSQNQQIQELQSTNFSLTKKLNDIQSAVQTAAQ
ncbi:hypothetical protein C1I91_06115 [Clostridium manihotivorum]|uniref:Uncharacterized protein n=1 Tax=Clostridium manihotivorum TaxID=2320868 RepID=A0A410E1P5_9CLOT|nr:hypothetical protein C1I91_06115 [Clostridium manihotivorum]